MTPKELVKQIKLLPKNPGVYTFRNARGELLYIGKAKSLKSRVSSYFRFISHPSQEPFADIGDAKPQTTGGARRRNSRFHLQSEWEPSPDLTPAKQLMVRQIDSLDTIIVSNETEALVLEAELIKRRKPPFNVVFVDDKSFISIKFDFDGVWPDVYPVRKAILPRSSRSLVFGPYPSARSAYTVLNLAKRIFPYCMKLPRHAPPRDNRGCLNWHLGRCPGPCVGKIKPLEYEEALRRMIPLFRGKYGALKKNIVHEMRRAAARKDFETAARLRDQIQSLNSIAASQSVVDGARESYDVLNCAVQDDVAAASLSLIRDGVLVEQCAFTLAHAASADKKEILESFASLHYSQTADVPPMLLVPEAFPSPFPAAMHIRVPARGKKRKLLLMGKDRAIAHLEHFRTQETKKHLHTNTALQLLAAALHLSEAPKRIEAFDISNIQGAHAVGAMTVAHKGELAPREYRNFTIRTIEGSNDVAMLKEMLMRRFAHSVSNAVIESLDHGTGDSLQSDTPKNIMPQRLNASTATQWPLPDLIVIDGGKPQLSIAQEVLKRYKLRIPLLGIAKGRGLTPHERRERGEEIWFNSPNTSNGQNRSAIQPMPLPALHLIDRLRDEAHRRGISHYRNRHRKSFLT